MKTIAAVVLAAGASSRLGQPKQLVMLDGETLLERSARLAREAGCAPVLVVLGADAGAIRSRCSLADAVILDNPYWQQGMAASIRAGVAGLVQASVAGVVVMACDQPAVSAEHLRALMVHSERSTASAYARRRGIPAYFPRYLFADLLLLSGDAGARELLVAADAIELPNGEFDIDQPAALLALQKSHPTRGPRGG